VLDDGSYEGLVVDVNEDDGVVLSITIVAGAHKGEVVDVRAAGMHDDAVDLLAMPCVLTVVDGQPSVVFD
jgi:hypothetical protein